MIKKIRPKAILFIGFHFKTELIEIAKKEGYKTVLIMPSGRKSGSDLFDDSLKWNQKNPQSMKRVSLYLKKKYRVMGIVSNYEQYVVPRSYLAEQLGLPSPSVYSACCSRNKLMQRRALSFMEHRVSFNKVETYHEAKEAFDKLEGDIFLKTIAGSKSRMIYHVTDDMALKEAFSSISSSAKKLGKDFMDDYSYCDFKFQYPDPKKVFLAEKTILGKQLTIASIVGSHSIWHAPSACDIYTASDIGFDDGFLAIRILPSKRKIADLREAKKTTDAVIGILGIRYSPVHTELILTPDKKIKLIETASRMGGYRSKMYHYAYGIDLNLLHLKAVMGKPVRGRKKAKCYVACLEIFPKKKGVLKKIKNFESLRKAPELLEYTIKTEVGQGVGPAKEGYDPILSFFIKGKSYDEVYKKSLEWQKKLVVEVETI